MRFIQKIKSKLRKDYQRFKKKTRIWLELIAEVWYSAKVKILSADVELLKIEESERNLQYNMTLM